MTRSNRMILASALVLAALGISATAVRVAALQRHTLVADDFTQDFVSAKAWRTGEDPYGLQREQGPRLVDVAIEVDSLRPEHRNPHTPAQFAVVAPLTALSYRAARTIWLLLSAALFVAALYGVGRHVGLARHLALAAALAALAIPIVQNDLLYGQIGGPLLALIVLAWLDGRAGRQTRMGVALGAAAAIKLFPAFLLIPLVRRRQFRGAATTAMTAAALSGAAMLAVGGAATRAWLNVAAPENFRFWRAAPVNISLPGHPFRWLTASPWRTAGPDNPALATALAVGLVVLCAGCAFVARGAVTRDAFTSALPWMLLAGPLTGDLSLTLVLPCVFVLVKAVRDRGGTWFVLALVAFALVVGTPPEVPGPRPDLSVATVVVGFGLPGIALLVLGLFDALATPGERGG